MDISNDTPVEFHAAMFMRIGRGVKLSRSGFSVVFEEPVCGRTDLSGTADEAERQLRAAGIDPTAVTPTDVQAYQQWQSGLQHARRIGGARIVITATHREVVGHEFYPANTVRLIDGLGEHVDSHSCRRIEYWDGDATSRLGGQGAARHSLNCAKVEASINLLRTVHPEFRDAPVHDNSGEFVGNDRA